MAESVNSFFSNKENMKILRKLYESGVGMTAGRLKEKDGALHGKTVVITGTLNAFSRSEAEGLIRKLGGNPSSSISKATDFLVAGGEPGSKLDKAKKLGVRIIGEDEFKKILNSEFQNSG